ncbi:acyl-CoA dehydrogenase [Staphylococcus gallinarum]|uniref:Acyl-CoA dehydrogenase n=1 Tax=Staphylococcus gallinarum TaxID=1293 RepID=A0A380FCK4_STAGA|nr:acyl-CoA dehydrogenase [Staphylococcus gallinarum]
MTTKEEVIKALYPEDILSVAKDLTEGEVKLLKQLNDMLEEKYRDSVNEHWLNATEPEATLKN